MRKHHRFSVFVPRSPTTWLLLVTLVIARFTLVIDTYCSIYRVSLSTGDVAHTEMYSIVTHTTLLMYNVYDL